MIGRGIGVGFVCFHFERVIMDWYANGVVNIVIPWGRVFPLREDLPKAVKSQTEGGNGNAEKFWDWNEDQVKNYL